MRQFVAVDASVWWLSADGLRERSRRGEGGGKRYRELGLLPTTDHPLCLLCLCEDKQWLRASIKPLHSARNSAMCVCVCVCLLAYMFVHLCPYVCQPLYLHSISRCCGMNVVVETMSELRMGSFWFGIGASQF